MLFFALEQDSFSTEFPFSSQVVSPFWFRQSFLCPNPYTTKYLMVQSDFYKIIKVVCRKLYSVTAKMEMSVEKDTLNNEPIP